MENSLSFQHSDTTTSNHCFTLKCKAIAGRKNKCKFTTGLLTKSVNFFQDDTVFHVYPGVPRGTAVRR